jgi:hypothetical protein
MVSRFALAYVVCALSACLSVASADVTTVVTPASLTTTSVTTTATTETLTTVAPASVAPAADAYWTVATQPQKLKDYSDRKFDAFTVTLTNTQPYHVQILQGEVANALNEQQLVAEKSNKSGSGGGRILGNLALGAASTGLHFAGLGAGSMGAFRALSLGQNAIAATSTAINHTPQGNLQITGKYIQRFNEVVLGQNQSFSFDVVMPKNQTPNLRLVFKNLETNQILDFAK